MSTALPRAPARGALRLAPTLLMLALTSACGGGEATEGEPPAPPVEIVAARSGALPDVVRLEGTVRAADQVEIRSEFAAPIVEVLVQSGDTVRRGQALVRLRDVELADQLRQAEATLRLEEAAERAESARFDELVAGTSRTRALAAEGLTSPLTLETDEARVAAARAAAAEAAARVERARATLDERRAALARATLRAPVSGRVGQVTARVGAMADPAEPLFQLGDPTRLLIEIRPVERELATLRVGQPAEIRATALGDGAMTATLSRLSPFLAAGSFSAAGEIDLDNRDGRLLPGMFVTVDIATGAGREGTLLPATALSEDPRTGELGVWVVASGPESLPPEELSTAAFAVGRRPVTLLGEGRGLVAVEGLAAGEWAVAVGQHLLDQDGRGVARVRVATWERLLALQMLQSEDVLARFLEKQRRLAGERATELERSGTAAPAQAGGS